MLEGYSIREQIHRGRRRVVCRAIRDADAVPVIIKTVPAEALTERDAADLKREFDILDGLNIDGVARAHELSSHADGLHLILEDRGGVTLAQHVRETRPDLVARIRLAIELTGVLAELHARNVVHKDINPSNVLVHPGTGGVTLIDFSISTQRGEELLPVSHPGVLEGTLAYLAPEQTGRMNRPVDYRSDFYSLGATLYELFAGQPPFDAQDAMELVHCHMAVLAPPLADRVRGLPRSLGRVVHRLLEKAPEDRYQSADGVVGDLRECLQHVRDGVDPPAFRPGGHELRDRFSIPRKLYGRGDERAWLLDAFERIGRHGAELALISGFSGIGKSALAHSVQGAIVRRRGYFVAGKFDQLRRTLPYSAVATALGELVRQLLTEPDEALAEWKRRLQTALAEHGRLIVDVVPEVEWIVGPQPAVPPLEGEEGRNRFRGVVQRFVREFCRRDHPLVLFLDDLQWADPASLDLIEVLLADDGAQYLLVIGAYRDNEVDDSHPLMATVESLRANGAAVSRLALGPLSREDVCLLLEQTLHRAPDDLGPLLRLLVDKTAGNPFFLRQFLQTIHQRGCLTFDRARNGWDWDMDRLQSMHITDNVVELMVDRLRELPSDTQDALRLAACIGSTFDVSTLEVVAEKDRSDVHAALKPAIDQGLIVPERDPQHRQDPVTADGPSWCFLHDRVQQSAYALIEEPRRRRAHLRIGRRLLASVAESRMDEGLFEIVDHLDLGRGLIDDADELRRLARLNLQAARRALAATAYAAATQYASEGRACLPADGWEAAYELTRDLCRAEADAHFLQGDFERSKEALDAMMPRLKTPLERAELHRLLLTQYTLGGRYPEAVDVGRRGLELLGVELSIDQSEQAIEDELALYRKALGSRQPSDLIDLPEMSSPEMRVAMQLLAGLCPLGYIADPSLYRLAVCRMVNLSLAHGHSPDSALGFAFFGLLHSSVLHDYPAADRLGRLALALAERFEDLVQACRASHTYCAFINHWQRPLREFAAINSRGFEAGVRSGELQFAGYHRYNRALCLFYLGVGLQELAPQLDDWVRFGTRTRNQHVADNISGVSRVVADLRGESSRPGCFDLNGNDEAAFLEDLRTRKARPALCHFHVMKAQALYLYGRVDEAHRAATEAAAGLQHTSGHVSVAVQNFYESLILLSALHDRPSSKRMEQVQRNQERLQRWADGCPQNFLHKHRLVEAEIAWLNGDVERAADGFDQAIELAARHGYLQEETLARERAGRFWLDRGRKKIAGLYLGEARRGYQLWGATTKVRLLEEEHAGLLAGTANTAGSADAGSAPFFTLVSSSGAALDFASVMKASRTISGEIDLDRLTLRLVRIAVETAGAQTGRLLLLGADGLRLEATSTIDEGETRLTPPMPVDDVDDLPPTVLNYVTRTGEALTLADAAEDPRFAGDEVIGRRRPRSILCLPIATGAETLGVLYLEHNLAPDAFTGDRVQVLQSLAAQAAISLKNARLYEERRRTEVRLRETLGEVEQLKNRLEAENLYLQEEISTQHRFEEIVGKSPEIAKVLRAVETVAPTDATVLILGETGTGKELFARAIHELGDRKAQSLIKVNCAALPAGLIESELFGHEKGAFTGAVSRKVGRFELADGGSIFLDEIGDLPLDLQSKLLRVLQEGEFERVGGADTRRVDVRVVAATNRDLVAAMKDGTFREDLYYRLNVFPLAVPALRQRKGDIPLLVRHFVMKYGVKLARRVETISQRHMDALQQYPWPGNVRELENVIERAMILSQGPELQLGDWSGRAAPPVEPGSSSTLQDVERAHILRVLEQTGWQLGGDAGAAAILGLKRTTLQGRMRKLGIRRDS